jgi:hypothetical protein
MKFGFIPIYTIKFIININRNEQQPKRSLRNNR